MKLWILLVATVGAAFPQDQDKAVVPLEIGRRVALLIGNTRYQNQTVIPAASADVDDKAATLRTLGFRPDDILVRKDLDMSGMTSALSVFRSKIRLGDLAVFYYSGHGGHSGEQNYLLPIDFQAVNDAEILPRVAYPMSEIRDRLERSGALVRLLVFDACRTSNLINGKDIGGGLREIGIQPEGTLIAYASAHNQIAGFSTGERNSVYTAALLAELRHPLGSLKEMLEKAQSRVYQATVGKQTPYLYGFLSGPVYFGARPSPAAIATTPQVASSRCGKTCRWVIAGVGAGIAVGVVSATRGGAPGVAAGQPPRATIGGSF